MRKKAISPLIATVLLIAFTMTIAGLILSFSTGFVGTQQASTSDKSAAALNCAYRLRINSASYNGTSATLKIRVTNEDQSSPITNITFSVINQGGSSSVYNTAQGNGAGKLNPGETDFFSNASVPGGCNITAVYVSSSCPNARDSVSSSGIDFSGC